MDHLVWTYNSEYCNKNGIRAGKNDSEAHKGCLKISSIRYHERDDEVKSHIRHELNGIGVSIKGLQSLKQHTKERANNMKMVKCKDIDNSSPFVTIMQ
ncbi:14965_t:CDS:2 [Dentiscutata erythropus]|uniref:14965_t:CDS:1 n=1 Tax=Dentiscutata erythropus TaxID=1348616 RepID=A0A9N9E712_9GLOM|nr:14965_t:CDS:2 [Dentiscutata erythropus]